MKIITNIAAGYYLMIISILSLNFTDNLYGAVIHVPSDYSTIQAAIDAAVSDDTISVADGVYNGIGNYNIDLNGKSIIVQSENGPEKCIIDCERAGRGFYCVNGEGPDSVISGFTIVNGLITGDAGGAIYCNNSSPTIMNCLIHSNDSVFDITAGGSGGGIYCINSSPVISGCTIRWNEATNEGGGIGCSGNSHPVVQNSVISKNFAENGGGIHITTDSELTATNLIICNNNVRFYGSGVYCSNSILTMVNCTITENTSNYNYWGSGVYGIDESTVSIKNSIIWNNDAVDFQLVIISPATINASYSNIYDAMGPFPGPGNIYFPPDFENPVKQDYHLKKDSPCINAGTSDGAPVSDIDGDLRPQDMLTDIGADEYNDSYPPLTTVYLQPGPSEGKDTWVVNWATESQGELHNLQTNRESYNQFTLIEFDLSEIPSDADIINAELWLFQVSGYSNLAHNIVMHQILTPWTEDVLLADKPAWDTSTIIDDTYGFGYDWFNWTLTDLAQDWIDGVEENYGVVLYGVEDTNGYWNEFFSSDYPYIPELKPYMKITYKVCPDFNSDNDVDGSDLAILAENLALFDMEAFSVHYGMTGCLED